MKSIKSKLAVGLSAATMLIVPLFASVAPKAAALAPCTKAPVVQLLTFNDRKSNSLKVVSNPCNSGVAIYQYYTYHGHMNVHNGNTVFGVYKRNHLKSTVYFPGLASTESYIYLLNGKWHYAD